MTNELVINARPHETRVALVENSTVVELHIKRGSDQELVGNIYLGRVLRVLPGMQAAFVDIGIEHITCSMLKLYPSQISKVESNLKISLKNLMYLKQEAEYFIRDNIRLEYLTLIKKKCEEYGITFAICRESLIPDTDTAFCDPFHLLSSYKPKKKIENKFYTMEDFI